ncbi:hypothetical protein [Pseudomonas sp. TE50-2]|uniref:hypothetical protein n=1 Tax=Pseudomonas sp. TE50-2 TaxID=3142707 RepID=UPI0034660B0B
MRHPLPPAFTGHPSRMPLAAFALSPSAHLPDAPAMAQPWHVRGEPFAPVIDARPRRRA